MRRRCAFLPLLLLAACQASPERAPATGPAPSDAVGARIEVYGPI